MRQNGVLTRWDDERGFGFITPVAGGPDVFVHVSELPRGPRPVVGTPVTFLPGRDQRQRVRAVSAEYVGPAARRRAASGGGVALGAGVSLSFLTVVGLLAAVGVLPVAAVAVSVPMSLLAFALYRGDKAAAARGSRRTPESTLQLVSLLGGWPGALVAQRVFRHKTRKQPFQTVFWFTVAANCAALAWIALGPRLPF